MTKADRKKTAAQLTRRAFSAGAAGVFLPASLAAEPLITGLIVPGPAGSGFDMAARAMSDAMLSAGLAGGLTHRNISDPGGKRAVASFAYDAQANRSRLLVHSSPLILRLAKGNADAGFKEIVPVAGLIEEPAILAVRPASKIESMYDLAKATSAGERMIVVTGGSPPGGMDHLVAVAVFEALGIGGSSVIYKGGGGATAALRRTQAGEAEILSAGLGEIADIASNGEMRILGIGDDQRSERLPDVPTFTERGAEVSFRNWRCVYGAPGLTAEAREQLTVMMGALHDSAAWKDASAARGWKPRFITGEAFADALQAHQADLKTFLRKVRFV